MHPLQGKEKIELSLSPILQWTIAPIYIWSCRHVGDQQTYTSLDLPNPRNIQNTVYNFMGVPVSYSVIEFECHGHMLSLDGVIIRILVVSVMCV
jgi:hypothetical protein